MTITKKGKIRDLYYKNQEIKGKFKPRLRMLNNQQKKHII